MSERSGEYFPGWDNDLFEVIESYTPDKPSLLFSAPFTFTVRMDGGELSSFHTQEGRTPTRQEFNRLVQLMGNLFSEIEKEYGSIENYNRVNELAWEGYYYKHNPRPQTPKPPKPEALHKKVSGYVYLVKGQANYYKIGKTTNVSNRTRMFEVKLPFEIELLHVITSNDYTLAERHFHNLFSAKRGNGEWFQLEQAEIDLFKSFDVLDF